MYGKTYWGALRSTFIVDGDGTIAAVLPKVQPKVHEKLVFEALDGLGARS